MGGKKILLHTCIPYILYFETNFRCSIDFCRATLRLATLPSTTEVGTAQGHRWCGFTVTTCGFRSLAARKKARHFPAWRLDTEGQMSDVRWLDSLKHVKEATTFRGLDNGKSGRNYLKTVHLCLIWRDLDAWGRWSWLRQSSISSRFHTGDSLIVPWC